MSKTTEKNRRQKQNRQFVLHLVRIVIFILIIVLIRSKHQEFLKELKLESSRIDLDLAGEYFQQGVKVEPAELFEDSFAVFDSKDNVLGYLLETSPQCDSIIGFSGPTNCLIVLSADRAVLDIKVISSGDTEEHLIEVQENSKFWDSIVGSPAGDLKRLEVDAVSGATLTSFAIAQSVQLRLMAQSNNSLKFPDKLDLGSVKKLFPNAVDFTPTNGNPGSWDVKDGTGRPMGTVIRSSPAADNVVGYQGPTDCLIGRNKQKQVTKLQVLSSFDNEPYVRYIKEDVSFAAVLAGKTIEQIGKIDLSDADFDGVSGATMTSQAVIAGVKICAVEFMRNAESPAPASWISKLKTRDVGTTIVVFAGVFLAFSRLRGSRRLRLIFQLLLIGYLGLVNGDMLSQALIVGWSQTQPPLSTAFGLVVLSFAALVLPILSRRNVYCSHLCPHGALQELVKKRLPCRIRLSSSWRRSLKMIPAVLLTWCLLVAMLHLPFSLVNIEPFNAWVFRISGWATLVVAIVGIIFAFFVPMAYCKFGCPTGAVLQYLRFNSQSDRWNRADSLACSLLLLAVAMRVFS